MIRLWLFVPEVQKEFECSLPENASLADCIPYLNRLLGDELERWYEIPDDALFIDTDSGIRVSNAVTMIHLNLRDGMRLLVC
jgi:hypothetical protein